MKFCETCGNVLLPKRNKSVLFCKVCNKDYPLESKKELELYKRKQPNKKKTSAKNALKTAIVTDADRSRQISEEDREAYEDLFAMSEDFSGDD